jgi:hypothetical protein
MRFTLDVRGDMVGQLMALRDDLPRRVLHGEKIAAKLGVFYVREEAPVRDGSLQNSIYYVASDGETDYPEAKAAAAGSPGHVVILPQIPTPKEGADVGACVRHAKPVNFGYTHARNNTVHVPANPFFSRGIARARAEFKEIMREAIAGTLVDRS